MKFTNIISQIRKAALVVALIFICGISTASATDITLSGSESYTAQDGDVLTGSTSGTVTIANNAKITLSDVTITGGIVCAGTAEITLVGTNSVSNTWYSSAGIQIGSSGTTLTIKGDGSLNATGGSAAAGIGLGRTWNANATGGSVVIEGGTVTASGGNGIGTGTVGNSMTAHMDGIIIKGGTVNARLGKGTINYGSSVTIGTIKIYDTIDKVDASVITESVTYMHVDGNTETDVTASASTYFTIIEDGDRCIIEKKDNTDYTITIADNSENGTIACAATTAKYGEKITITATPNFGYRLSRLVVKDAQNNDVASTGNSFFMPKSNVTVSAVFEQGVHGTTEFAWGYSGPDGFVTEATIYDGVTTVELQQEKSYRIFKYVNEYSYRKFHLDNDVYAASIPYTGGTGVFPEKGNATNFRVPYDGELGFYDITMTDVGNGKWNVSILKTAGQMDVVPDQTYTGSEITPEPLVMAGSLNLTKGTDYVYSYTNNTNAGTAKVRATFQGDYASLGSVEKEFTIVKATPTVTAPTAVADLIYNGSKQELVTAGSTDFGTLLYSLDGENYSADIPTATNAGTHTVYYKVARDNNHNDVFGSLDVTIAPKAVTNEDITVTIPSQTWTGNELTPVITVKDGETVLTLDEDYTVTAPSGPVEDFGNHAYTITGRGNYAGSREAMFTITPYLAITADGQTISDATTWKNGLVSITGNSTVTFSERITISGTVTLNLGEGATLIAPKGIEVDKGNTLTIEGNGALNATADKFYAAIGRGYHDATSGTSGTININGGTVTAIGGRFAAAIGGGYEGVSGTINISGGTIVATGGYCAAGIGGGTFAACGVVNISGGQVTANGDRASGIGPGFDAGTSGTVTLGWTTESDGILASNYNDVETLRVADGKAFTASTEVYMGILDDDQRAEIAGKTLKPVICTGVTLTKESQGITATIDGTSTATINIPTAITVDDVTYNRTFTDGKLSTVMLPFNKAVSEISGGTFYTFGGMKKENDKWVATMNEVTGSIESNTPYLVMPAGTSLTFSGGATLNTTCDGQTAEYDGFELRGTYTEKVWEENDPEIGKAYVYNANGELVPVAAGTRIRPTECYIIQTKKLMTGTDITVTIPSQIWTGSELTPVITVKDGEAVLTENTDYTVTPPSGPIQDAGNYTYTINGMDNYSGTVEKTFSITPKVTTIGALTLTEDQNGKTAVIDGAYTGEDAFAIGEDIEVASVTFNRTFTTSATSTIILPFDITEGNYSGGDFYTFKSVENNIADMTKVTSVTAHTPYLFVPDGETFSITGNVTIEATSATEYATESEDGKWEFKGIYKRKRWGAEDGDNKDYCFAANAIDDISVGEFVKIGTYVQVKPFRCYLTRKNDISKSAEQLPETIQIRLIDETASVITADDPQENTGDITTPVSEIANNNGVKVWSYDGAIYIESAPSTAYTIVDMTGRTLKNGVTNSTRETVTLSRTAGIVIVIINGKTFKVNY